ncbi:hypothetical protein ACFWH4_08125 [Streptomyces sp. NPDC127091]
MPDERLKSDPPIPEATMARTITAGIRGSRDATLLVVVAHD